MEFTDIETESDVPVEDLYGMPGVYDVEEEDEIFLPDDFIPVLSAAAADGRYDSDDATLMRPYRPDVFMPIVPPAAAAAAADGAYDGDVEDAAAAPPPTMRPYRPVYSPISSASSPISIPPANILADMTLEMIRQMPHQTIAPRTGGQYYSAITDDEDTDQEMESMAAAGSYLHHNLQDITNGKRGFSMYLYTLSSVCLSIHMQSACVQSVCLSVCRRYARIFYVLVYSVVCLSVCRRYARIFYMHVYSVVCLSVCRRYARIFYM